MIIEVDEDRPAGGDSDFEDRLDCDLVLRAQSGDERALVTILRKYAPATRSKASRFFLQGAEREDVVQEAMIGLFQAVRDFDPSRCAKFRVFAVVCINRQIMTAVKVAGRNKHRPLNHADSLDVMTTRQLPIHVPSRREATDPAALAAANQDAEELQRTLLKELSTLEAAALHLYVQGNSYKEIACRLGSPTKAVDNAIQRVRSKIKRHLKTRARLAERAAS